jgi:hypothetical protein
VADGSDKGASEAVADGVDAGAADPGAEGVELISGTRADVSEVRCALQAIAIPIKASAAIPAYSLPVLARLDTESIFVVLISISY